MEPQKIAKHLIEGWSMTSRPSKIGEAFFGFWSSAILVEAGALSELKAWWQRVALHCIVLMSLTGSLEQGPIHIAGE